MRESSEIWFATSNDHKFEEAMIVLRPFRISPGRILDKGPELQSDDPGEIAAHAAKKSFLRERKPLFTEDTGLYIESLGGFPGTYASHAYQTLGIGSILKLVPDSKREAEFTSAVAYCAGPGQPRVFKGTLNGKLAPVPRGHGGFGFDSVFIPEYSTKTLAEISIREKCRISHRAMALRTFAKWFASRPDG